VLAEIVSVEETSTQVQVVFTEALEREGLAELVSARQDGLVDPTVDDPARPVLLALSDIHPEWRADEPVRSGRPRRFIGDRRSSVTAAIAIGAACADSLPVDRGGGRGPRRRGAVALLGT
jgi:hypothetical protein